MSSRIFRDGALAGQVALVTGGGTNLGKAVATELAACGATVVIAGRREEVLVDTVGEEGRLAGRTRDFKIVHLEGPASLLGRLVEVEIRAAGPNAVIGSLPETTH